MILRASPTAQLGDAVESASQELYKVECPDELDAISYVSSVEAVADGFIPTLVVDGDARSTAPSEWRDDPTAIFVRESGCYTFQIDGSDFQAILILRARAAGQD